MHLLTLSVLPLVAAAANLELYIPATASLPNPGVLPSSSRASLSSAGVPIVVPLTRYNTFVFSGVKPGSYLLSAHSRDTTFEGLRVDIDVNGEGIEEIKAWTTWSGNEWSNKGEVRGQGEGSARIELRAVAAKVYYQERATFSLTSIFKNPMILIALFTLVMVVGVPYLMENLDPEVKKELEDMQKSKKSVTASTNQLATRDFAGDFASWMAGSSGQKEKR